jgi:hypothetical protein
MSVRCAIGGHRAAPREVYNSGYYFSACVRCGKDLVRAARTDWQTPPAGHRIVWKAGRASHSIEADYADFLPVALATAALLAVPSPFASWSRVLVRLPPKAAPRAVAVQAAAIEESGDFRCPRLLLMAVMVGAGLRLLLSPGAAR